MAVAIRERFAEISEEWRRRGHVLQVGMGIATGYATMGRIGFEGRYDYGGIGNAIILASRLSSEAKAGEILISQRTLAAIDGGDRGRAGRRAPAQGVQPADRGACGPGLAAPSDVPASARGRDDDARSGGPCEPPRDDRRRSAFVDELVDTFLSDAGVGHRGLRAAASSGDDARRSAAGALAEVEQPERRGDGAWPT